MLDLCRRKESTTEEQQNGAVYNVRYEDEQARGGTVSTSNRRLEATQ